MSSTSVLPPPLRLWHHFTKSLCGTTGGCLMLSLLLCTAIGSMRGQVPGCVAYTANYPCVYVVNSGPDTVSVINSTTNTVVVPAVAVGGTPMGAAITPDNRSVYVVNNDDGTVSIVDTTTNTVPTQAVLLVSNNVGLGSPTQVAITPDGTAAYVVGIGSSGFVAIINTKTQKLDLAITTGLSSPTAIAFSPDGKFAYITDSCPNVPSPTACVDVLDTSTHLINQAAGTPIQIPGSVSSYGESIAVTADGGLICVPVDDLNNNLGIAFISVIYNPINNTYTYTYVTTLSLNVTSTTSDYGIAITPSGTLYAAEPAVNSVAVVDTNTQTLTNTIQVGNSPTGVAATPDGAQVYVSNGFAGSVSVIDTQTQKVTSTLAVQTSPAGVAVMPTIVPTIQTQPASQTIAYLLTTSLSVEASGSNPLSYQWYQVSGSTPVPIAGATSSSFTTPALTSTTAYLVSVSNLAGSIESNAATVTVLPPVAPVISSQPASQTINSGQTANLSIQASGTQPLSYQWYQVSGTTLTPIQGASASSFTTPALISTTSYAVVVSNIAGSTQSNTATITVTIQGPPDFTMGAASGSPTSQTINAGQSAPFTLSFAGTGSFSGTVNLTCAITPIVTFAPTCNLSSSSVEISGSTAQTAIVKVETIAPTTASVESPGAWPRGITWSILILSVLSSLFVRSRKRRAAFAAPVLFGAIALFGSCGGNGMPGKQVGPGTQAGTYTATVTATSGTLTHNMALQVIVQ